MRAFSLVELSIVLVILGLLTGGVLTGQSLIRAAEIRSVATDLSRYRTAVYAFRDRYMSMPGDMRNATDFWGDVSLDGVACPGGEGAGTHTCNGNGDGRLSNAEGFRLWQHLANAGLVEGRYAGIAYETSSGALAGYNSPVSKLSASASVYITGWGPYDTTDEHNFPMGRMTTMRFGEPICRDSGRGTPRCPVLRPEEAWNIDGKLDDGKPATGKLMGYKKSSGMTPDCATSDDAANAEYNLKDTAIRCAIYVTLD